MDGLAGFVVPEASGVPAAVGVFWRLWREERFFECHEVLEELWRETSGRERWFYNGLINCAVAVYQHRRGNAVGAARQLRRATVKLESFRPAHAGVAIDGLLAAVDAEIEKSLAQLTPAQRAGLDEVRRVVERKMQRDGVMADASVGI